MERTSSAGQITPMPQLSGRGKVAGSLMCNPKFYTYPEGYDGKEDDQLIVKFESVVNKIFVICEPGMHSGNKYKWSDCRFL